MEYPQTDNGHLLLIEGSRGYNFSNLHVNIYKMNVPRNERKTWIGGCIDDHDVHSSFESPSDWAGVSIEVFLLF